MLAKVAKFSDLSFIDDAQQWHPMRTGDYAADCSTGRRYADELIGFIRWKNCPLAFGQVIKAISAQGVLGAVEIGFCSRIGIELIGMPARCR